mgnify:CR=1 FL=1
MRWRAAGVWDRLLEAVSAACNSDIVMIDSSCVRVHQHGAAIKNGGEGGTDDRCMGRSRGGLTAKICALADAEGRPIHLALTAGQAGDAPTGRELLARLAPGCILLADKANDTDTIRAESAERGTFANVPPRVIRKRTFAFSPWLYRQRNQIGASSITSSKCVASPRATTGDPTTSSQPSSSPEHTSGSKRYEAAP